MLTRQALYFKNKDKKCTEYHIAIFFLKKYITFKD